MALLIPNNSYKGIKYYIHHTSSKCNFYISDYSTAYPDKYFLTEEDVKRYIDKVLLREKKLKRLRVV